MKTADACQVAFRRAWAASRRWLSWVSRWRSARCTGSSARTAGKTTAIRLVLDPLLARPVARLPWLVGPLCHVRCGAGRPGSGRRPQRDGLCGTDIAGVRPLRRLAIWRAARWAPSVGIGAQVAWVPRRAMMVSASMSGVVSV